MLTAGWSEHEGRSYLVSPVSLRTVLHNFIYKEEEYFNFINFLAHFSPGVQHLFFFHPSIEFFLFFFPPFFLSAFFSFFFFFLEMFPFPFYSFCCLRHSISYPPPPPPILVPNLFFLVPLFAEFVHADFVFKR